jgi:hypothetical protein
MTDMLELTMHGFKSGIARYIDHLLQRRYRAVVVCRRREPVAIVTPILPHQRAAIRAELDRARPATRTEPSDLQGLAQALSLLRPDN